MYVGFMEGVVIADLKPHAGYVDIDGLDLQLLPVLAVEFKGNLVDSIHNELLELIESRMLKPFREVIRARVGTPGATRVVLLVLPENPDQFGIDLLVVRHPGGQNGNRPQLDQSGSLIFWQN